VDELENAADLIDSHKQNVQDIAQRFPRDVESYSKMMSVQTGLQTVITTLNLSYG